MTRYPIVASWRQGKGVEPETVEVVTEPDRAWFQDLYTQIDGCQLFRISVLNNGEVFFGDAHTVLHYDITRMRPIDHVEPILVAVFVRKNDQWRIGNAQHWGTRPNDLLLTSTRSLLARLRVWDDVIVPALGNDPLLLPSLEAEFMDL